MKAKPNSYYIGKDNNFYLYIDEDFEVGFGSSKEQAKETCGRHNHWLHKERLLNADVLKPLAPISLENK